MDTRFSVAIHTLILISEVDVPLTSEQIAASVGTNPSYIRKITGLLKRKGIVESRRGIGGFQLTGKPEDLSLCEIYQAVDEVEAVHVFDLHQNSSEGCFVGRHIQPVLSDVFREIEVKAEQKLKDTSLADCIEKMKTEISREHFPEAPVMKSTDCR